jgi:hypothetical protein
MTIPASPVLRLRLLRTGSASIQRAAVLGLAALAACGSDPGEPPVTGEYVPLVSAEWTLQPGQEDYICSTRTLTQDVYAGALRPIGPPGTHHTVVALVPTPEGPDRPAFRCAPEFGEFWASGLGTGELVLPDGVGLLAPAGSQLRLSLHLFNATDAPLSGTSGLEARLLPPSSVVHEAQVTYHGPFSFSIPPDGAPYTAGNQVPLGEKTLVGIFPHMHQLGRHFRARIVGAGGETPLWDGDFQFESQEIAPLPSVRVRAGDQLETTCTWVNTTGDLVRWGDSSNAEMCFSILVGY